MKLSVIVPVYNVEAYLSDCLDSLLEQGLTDYEIICVDDGSTDRSGEIAQGYAQRHPQIRVLRQPNGGASAARNTGIHAALGEYVHFMDSDDLLVRGVLGDLYQLAAQNGLDQLLFDYETFEGARAPSWARVEARCLSLFPSPLEMRKSREVPQWRIGCNYLVRRSVLLEYGLEFPVGMIFEDAEFNFWLDRCAGQCGYLGQKLYFYRQRLDSSMHSFMRDTHFTGYIRGRVGLAEHYKSLLKDYRAGIAPKLRVPVSERELEERMIDEVQGILNRLLAKGDRALLEQTAAELRRLALYPYPLRWRRLLRKRPFRRRVVDAASFLYPVRAYFGFCVWVSSRLRKHV